MNVMQAKEKKMIFQRHLLRRLTTFCGAIARLKRNSYLLFLLSFFFFFLFTNETSSIIHYLPLNLPFYFFLDSLVFLLCYQFSDGPITATILAKNINIHASKSNDTRKYIFLSCFGGAGLVIIYIMSAMF